MLRLLSRIAAAGQRRAVERTQHLYRRWFQGVVVALADRMAAAHNAGEGAQVATLRRSSELSIMVSLADVGLGGMVPGTMRSLDMAERKEAREAADLLAGHVSLRETPGERGRGETWDLRKIFWPKPSLFLDRWH